MKVAVVQGTVLLWDWIWSWLWTWIVHSVRECVLSGLCAKVFGQRQLEWQLCNLGCRTQTEWPQVWKHEVLKNLDENWFRNGRYCTLAPALGKTHDMLYQWYIMLHLEVAWRAIRNHWDILGYCRSNMVKYGKIQSDDVFFNGATFQHFATLLTCSLGATLITFGAAAGAIIAGPPLSPGCGGQSPSKLRIAFYFNMDNEW